MFYDFRQNNSGGSFAYDEAAGISHIVIVEADSVAEANARAQRIGLYFDGCESGYDCDCCGDRWYEKYRDDEGDPVPSEYGAPIDFDAPYPPASQRFGIKWMDGYEGFVHYKDGTVKGYGDVARERQTS